MDKQFTLKLQEWLNTPADKRNLNLGATYLLQLTNNKILYKNITRDLKGHAQFIEFKIKRYLQYRLQDMTHEVVSADETLDGSGVTATTQSKVAEQTPRETARLEQKNILRQINLAKGRYKKNPSEKLKASILSLFQQLTAPSDALTAELKLLGIL